jgi:hypothetical protein
MSSMRRLALTGVLALCGLALGVAEAITIPIGPSEDGPLTYLNAKVVAVDRTGRTLVVRNASGKEARLALDDSLAGFGDIKAGDQVMVTVRTGPGWARVSSIVKSREVPASTVVAAPSPKAVAAPAPGPRVPPVDSAEIVRSREVFSTRVASLSAQADGVDRVWSQFRSACDFREGNSAEGARGWFAIWEGSIRADLSSGFCRDLFNQLIDLGEPIKAGMTAAEDVARRTLLPGDIRDIRLRHRMAWEGWALTSPKQVAQ